MEIIIVTIDELSFSKKTRKLLFPSFKLPKGRKEFLPSEKASLMRANERRKKEGR